MKYSVAYISYLHEIGQIQIKYISLLQQNFLFFREKMKSNEKTFCYIPGSIIRELRAHRFLIPCTETGILLSTGQVHYPGT